MKNINKLFAILLLFVLFAIITSCEQKIVPTGELAENMLNSMDDSLSNQADYLSQKQLQLKENFSKNKTLVIQDEEGKDVTFLPLIVGDRVKLTPSIPFLPSDANIDVRVTYKVSNSNYISFNPMGNAAIFDVVALKKGKTTITFKAEFNYNHKELANEVIEVAIPVEVFEAGSIDENIKFISASPTTYLTLAEGERSNIQFTVYPLTAENSIAFIASDPNIISFTESGGSVAVTALKEGKANLIAYSKLNPYIYKVLYVTVNKQNSSTDKNRTGVSKLNLSADPLSLIATYEVTSFKVGAAEYKKASIGSELRVNADASKLGKGLIYIQIYLMVNCKPVGILQEKVMAEYSGIPEIFQSLGAEIIGDYELKFTLDSTKYPEIVAAGLVQDGEVLILNLDKNKNLSMGAKLGTDIEYDEAGRPLVDNIACTNKDRTGVTKLNLSTNPLSLIGQYELTKYRLSTEAEYKQATKGSQLRVNADASTLGQGYVRIPLYLNLNGKNVGFLVKKSLEGTDIPGIFNSLGAKIVGDYALEFTLDSKDYPEIVDEGLVKQGEILILVLDKDRDMSMGAGLGNDIAVNEDGKPIVNNADYVDPTKVSKIILDKTVISPSSVGKNDGEEVLKEHERVVINATVFPGTAENKKLIWESDNPEVASVRDGVVTILNPQKNTKIRVKSEENNEICAEVIITVPISKILISSDKEEDIWNPTHLNDTYNLQARVEPSTVSEEAKKLYYTSSNSEIASVDEHGSVTFKKNGPAVITVTAPNTELKATLKINPFPESIIFDEFEAGKCVDNRFSSGAECDSSKHEYEYIPYNEGDSFFLSTVMYDSIGGIIESESGINWKSDNEEVAIVENGNVKILKNGSAIISATYGSVTTTLHIREVKEDTGFKGFTLAEKEKTFTFVDKEAYSKVGLELPKEDSYITKQNIEDLIIVQPSILNTIEDVRKELIKNANFQYQLVDEPNERKAKLVKSQCSEVSAEVKKYQDFSIFCLDDSKMSNVYDDLKSKVAVIVKATVKENNQSKDIEKLFIANIVKLSGKITPVSSISVESIGEVAIDKSSKKFYFESGRGPVGKLNVKVNPLNATNQELEYKVTGDSISVDSNGNVTILQKTGDSEITVSTKKKGSEEVKVTKVYVSVAKYPTAINFVLDTPAKFSHGINSAPKIIRPDIQASSDANTSLKFTSSNELIATVVENTGAVSCLKSGTSLITATTVNNKSASYTLECYTVPDISNPSTLVGTYDFVHFTSDTNAGAFGGMQYVGTDTITTNKYRGKVQRMIGELTINQNGDTLNLVSKMQMQSSYLNTPIAGVDVSREQFAITVYNPIKYSGGASTFGSANGSDIRTVKVEKDISQFKVDLKLYQAFKKTASVATVPVEVNTYVKKKSDKVSNINNNTCYFNKYNGGNANARARNICNATPNEPHNNYGNVPQ